MNTGPSFSAVFVKNSGKTSIPPVKKGSDPTMGREGKDGGYHFPASWPLLLLTLPFLLKRRTAMVMASVVKTTSNGYASIISGAGVLNTSAEESVQYKYNTRHVNVRIAYATKQWTTMQDSACVKQMCRSFETLIRLYRRILEPIC